MNCLCYIPDDGILFDRVGNVTWPPVNPPAYTTYDDYKLIRGAVLRAR